MGEIEKEGLLFSRLQNGAIFMQSFDPFSSNNFIALSAKKPIAVLYAPNGVGKTSLANVLSGAAETLFELELGGKKYISDNSDSLFHVIQDQNGRNIIKGKTEDFILGDDIRRENELEAKINNELNEVMGKVREAFSRYGIYKKNSRLVKDYCSTEIGNDVGVLVSQKRSTAVKTYMKALKRLAEFEQDVSSGVVDLQSDKFTSFSKDIENDQSALRLFLGLEFNDINTDANVNEIAENTDAIQVLSKYAHKDNCIVCSNDIDSDRLLKEKEQNRKRILGMLDEKIRDQIEVIEQITDGNDYFGIKEAVGKTFENGDCTYVTECKTAIQKYGEQIVKIAVAEVKTILRQTDLFTLNSDLEQMRRDTPKLTNEDEIFLKDIVEQSMNRPIEVQRTDDNKRIAITIDEIKILNKDRQELPLSAGEQNFLSLAFEMLRAKNSSREIIVLDDPISSFDSIYKYKIIYAMLSSLERKKIIILTHNLDSVRLVRGQKGNCFSMYIFNNHDGGENGFVEVGEKEIELVTNLSKLTDFFRNITDYDNVVKDKRLFLIAIVPFMRGYAHIIGSKEYDTLMKLMHGRETEHIDVGECYKKLFGGEKDCFFDGEYNISVDDIIVIKIPKDQSIVDPIQYPLLNKTLIKTISFLRCRLLVEKRLIKKYNIPKRQDTTDKIIRAAYSGKTEAEKKKRTRLMVKKTLINEFNHFEGSLSIFQPAIDISDQMLKRETDDIDRFFAGDDW